jgi:hypothetical protein
MSTGVLPDLGLNSATMILESGEYAIGLKFRVWSS